jgi:hypothetical protein
VLCRCEGDDEVENCGTVGWYGMDLDALRRCFEGELYHLMSWSFLPPHHIDFLFHALVSAARVSSE